MIGWLIMENIKIKSGFMLREVAGQWVVVPLGEKVVEFNGIMTLTESGAMLWKVMEQGTNINSLIEILLQEYDIDSVTAAEDINEFIKELQGKNLLV